MVAGAPEPGALHQVGRVVHAPVRLHRCVHHPDPGRGDGLRGARALLLLRSDEVGVRDGLHADGHELHVRHRVLHADGAAYPGRLRLRPREPEETAGHRSGRLRVARADAAVADLGSMGVLRRCVPRGRDLGRVGLEPDHLAVQVQPRRRHRAAVHADHRSDRQVDHDPGRPAAAAAAAVEGLK